MEKSAANRVPARASHASTLSGNVNKPAGMRGRQKRDCVARLRRYGRHLDVIEGRNARKSRATRGPRARTRDDYSLDCRLAYGIYRLLLL